MDLFRIEDISHCSKCGSNGLVMVTSSGKKISAKEIIANDNILDATVLVNIKCPICNTVFDIDWSERIPRPLYIKTGYNKFLSYYS